MNVLSGTLHQQVEIPPLNLPEERSEPHERSFRSLFDADFSPLIAIRRAHQTDRAIKVMRTGRAHLVEDTTPADQPGKTQPTRRELLRDFADILRRNSDNKAVGSGLERLARWTSKLQVFKTGNAANADVAATQRAATVCLLCSWQVSSVLNERVGSSQAGFCLR